MPIVIDLAGKTPEQISASVWGQINAESVFAQTLLQHIPVDQSSGDIALDLVRLTLLLETVGGADPVGGGLGGMYGYGCRFENSVFGMHPYCWCDRDDCPWCMPCDCVEEYRHNGHIIDFDTFFDAREAADIPWDQDVPGYTEETIKHCPRHRKVDPIQEAPNFWHKASGVQISWYKYIGRSMEITVSDGINWTDVYASTVQSIGTMPCTYTPMWP